MSLYALQKLIREVNSDPALRAAFLQDAAGVAGRHGLTETEQAALVARDWAALYAMGVHGLLLRPFSILHKISEPDYLAAIRSPRAARKTPA